MDDQEACDCERCMPPRPMEGFLPTLTEEQLDRIFLRGQFDRPSPKPRKGLYDALGRN